MLKPKKYVLVWLILAWDALGPAPNCTTSTCPGESSLACTKASSEWLQHHVSFNPIPQAPSPIFLQASSSSRSHVLSNLGMNRVLSYLHMNPAPNQNMRIGYLLLRESHIRDKWLGNSNCWLRLCSKPNTVIHLAHDQLSVTIWPTSAVEVEATLPPPTNINFFQGCFYQLSAFFPWKRLHAFIHYIRAWQNI